MGRVRDEDSSWILWGIPCINHRYRSVCVYTYAENMYVCVYICTWRKRMHMFIYILLSSRKPYWHHWNHNEECKLTDKVWQRMHNQAPSQCYSLLQLKTSGPRTKLPSVRLEFAAELNRTARTPFLRHRYPLTSVSRVERLAPPTPGSATHCSKTHSWIMGQLRVNLLESPHNSAVKKLT